MRKVYQYVAALLVVAFAIYFTPQVLIHALHDHDDTVHDELVDEGPVRFETHHTHCDILSIEGVEFETSSVAHLPKVFDVTTISEAHYVASVLLFSSAVVRLRGPPII
jgi:hypothetical protein